MNCTYKSIIEANRDYEQMWIQERFTCAYQVQFFDFIYIYIFKLKQSASKMAGILFVSIFLYVNGTQLIFENFLCGDLIILLDYFKHFEYVAAFLFVFWLSYFSEFLKVLQTTDGNSLRPPNHSFAYFISSTVISLTFGTGLVYMLTKNKIRIPFYSTYLHFAAMLVFLIFFLLCTFAGQINYWLMLLPVGFYIIYIYFLFKFSAFDKFLEEKFRTTVPKEDFDLAYYYEPLSREQLEALNQKKQRNKINLDDLSDSEDEEVDQEAIKNKQNEFKKILLQQLEDEFKEKPTLLEKIERDLEVDKEKNYIIYTLERWVLIFSCLCLPSQRNFLTKTHLKVLVQYFGFCVGFTNLPGVKLIQIFPSAFFATIIYYCLQYFLQQDHKKMLKSLTAVFIVLSIANFISRIFLDIFLFFEFVFNLEKIDGQIFRGVFRIVPIMILTYVLAKKDRLIFGYAVLNVSIVGVIFISCILRFHNLIQYNLISTDLKELYKNNNEDRTRVSNQLSLLLFFMAFLIMLHLIYLYMREQIGNKNFGSILILIGFVYVVSNIMLLW